MKKSIPFTAWLGLAIVALALFLFLFGPLIAPHGQEDIVGSPFDPPSAQFWFGLDQNGRDMLSRMLYGAQMSIGVSLAASLLSFAVGVPLGFLAALRPGSWVDMLSMVFAVSGLSLPMFWLGLLLMYAFALTLGWFPSFGYGDGDPRYIVLPAVALGVSPLALLARTARAAVLEVMHADFIRTARAKGSGSYRVLRWHVLRNALVIVLTTLGLQFGSVLGQAVVVEKLFAWPGLGSLLVDSVTWRDIPVVQGCILTIVLFFLVVNIAVDVLCAVVDPRIKYS